MDRRSWWNNKRGDEFRAYLDQMSQDREQAIMGVDPSDAVAIAKMQAEHSLLAVIRGGDWVADFRPEENT